MVFIVDDDVWNIQPKTDVLNRKNGELFILPQSLFFIYSDVLKQTETTCWESPGYPDHRSDSNQSSDYVAIFLIFSSPLDILRKSKVCNQWRIRRRNRQ